MAFDTVGTEFKTTGEDKLLRVWGDIADAADRAYKSTTRVVMPEKTSPVAAPTAPHSAVPVAVPASQPDIPALTVVLKMLGEAAAKALVPVEKTAKSVKASVPYQEKGNLALEAWQENIKEAEDAVRGATTATEKHNAQLRLSQAQKSRPAEGSAIVGGLKSALSSVAGSVLSALSTVGKKIAPAIPSAVKAASGGAASMIGKAAPAAGKGAGAAMGEISKVVGGISSAIGGVASVVTGAIGAFTTFTDTIAGFVGAFNPAAVEILNLAFADLQATIGEALEPILQAIIPVVEKFGNAVASLDLGPLVDSFVTVFNSLADAFFTILEAIRPVQQMLVGAFAEAITALMPLVQPLTEALLATMSALQPLQQLLAGIFVETIKAIVPPLAAIISVVAKLLEALQPLIDLLADAFATALEWLMPLVISLADALVFLTQTVIEAVDWIMKKGGELWKWTKRIGTVGISMIWEDEEVNPASRFKRPVQAKSQDRDRAQAARGISFTGLEDASRKAIEAAGQQGAGRDERRTADNTGGILGVANAIYKTIAQSAAGGGPDAQKALDFLKQALGGGQRRAAAEAEDA